jgi:hypothetical protein
MLVRGAVEEGLPLCLGHGQDRTGLTLVPPFLRLGGHTLAGSVRDGGGPQEYRCGANL